MSVSAASPVKPGGEPKGPKLEQLQSLQVSAYDNTAGMIVALLMLLGVAVLVLLFLWLSMQGRRKDKALPVAPAQVQLGDGGDGGASEPDLAPVPPEEVPELTEPTPAQTLDVLTDAIALKKEIFDSLEPEPPRGGSGSGRGTGRGHGVGDGSGEPMPEWEVRFAVSHLDTYAHQLDFFKFELAVLGGDSSDIEFVSNLSAAKPTVRTASGSEEKRPYFSWKKGSPLLENDRKLLAKAGVASGGRLILQFYPEEIYQRLSQLERQASGGKRPEKTIFGVREAEKGFEFFVQDQVPPPKNLPK